MTETTRHEFKARLHPKAIIDRISKRGYARRSYFVRTRGEMFISEDPSIFRHYPDGGNVRVTIAEARKYLNDKVRFCEIKEMDLFIQYYELGKCVFID